MSLARSRKVERGLIGAAAVAALIVLPLYAAKVWLKTDYTDFLVYYRAAARARLHDWTDVYTLADGASPFRYAPALLVFFRPFAELALRPAQLLWYFIQFGFFFASYAVLARAMTAATRSRRTGWAIASFAFLYTLRFILDTFTIGQISSVMFFGFAVGMGQWMLRRPGRSVLALYIPSVLKIGPGFGGLLYLTSRKPAPRAAITVPLIVTGLLLAVQAAWLKLAGAASGTFRALWANWLTIVRADSVYYDSSHYGSQSLNSALLRLAKTGVISPSSAQELRLVLTILGCGLILAFWTLRRPRGSLGRGFFYCLGIFAYLWFMPETFKYSLTTLALPVSLMLASRVAPRLRSTDFRRFSTLALAFGLLTLSLPGKDIVGDTLFFGIQKLSLPFLATIALAIAVFFEAWARSVPSPLGRALGLWRSRESPGPWPALPARDGTVETTVLAPLPLKRGALVNAEVLARAIGEAKRVAGESAEVLVLPFGPRSTERSPLVEVARATGARLLFPERAHSRRGLALRDGFLASRGRALWVVNLEMPADAAFFDAARAQLAEGFSLVRANRRHCESRFFVPVKLLSLVYGRHRLGLLFNWVIRKTLAISAHDTHSGTFAVSRALAARAFALCGAHDFFFDLEFSLAAREARLKETDLPGKFTLPEEKSPARIGLEAAAIAAGLPKLWFRARQGCYAVSKPGLAITADDWGLSPGVNEGILELARKQVVKRVSLMANCPHLTHRLDELKNVPGLELGLHFNLTYGPAPLGGHGPGAFLREWMKPGRRHEKLAEAARTQLEEQLKGLESAGVQTRYLDGHHHIHLVPGLLRELAPTLKRAGIRRVRLPYDPALWFTTKFPLNVLAWLARGELKRQGFEHAPCFYPQSSHFQDPARLQAALSQHAEAEVIVHPARVNDLGTLEYPDSYTEGRVTEFRALSMLAALSEPAT